MFQMNFTILSDFGSKFLTTPLYFSNDWIYDACKGISRMQRSEIEMKHSWDACHLAINRKVPDALRSLNRNSSVLR